MSNTLLGQEKYPKNVEGSIQYGTAGFRTLHDRLDYVMYRMGLLATLRSRFQAGRTIGVMITASHNPEPDNGVKLVDPMGEMLAQNWEQLATDLVNVDDGQLQAQINQIVADQQIDVNAPSSVFVGMDNRWHSPRLLKAVSDGVIALGGVLKSYGVVTTPQLHYFVVCNNTNSAYGEATEEGYYKKLSTAFRKLRENVWDSGNYKNRLYFDGANGVGSPKMLALRKHIGNALNVEVYNSGDGVINQDCGADYVKVNQTVPRGIPDSLEPYTRCVAVDGDADRVVYFFLDGQRRFQLLDGDRIATLIAGYLMDLVRKCGVDVTIGIVQTAYANGASTHYIQNQLNVPVACTSTGVKHLHHKATEYDIGVYFEANGHGTVIFSPKAHELIARAAENSSNSLSSDQVSAAHKLLLTIDVINETVGDAISDMLLVETILLYNGWDVSDWLNTYDDLANTLRKIKVADRAVVTTANAERQCVTPAGLQDEIDRAVAKYSRGRSFVRASGTEDVVRVYAEADSKEAADRLAADVEQLVFTMAGGVA